MYKVYVSHRQTQLTFVLSASAKPPPTSRATFHGMEAWNSLQEIMVSGWRETKISCSHLYRKTEAVSLKN